MIDRRGVGLHGYACAFRRRLIAATRPMQSSTHSVEVEELRHWERVHVPAFTARRIEPHDDGARTADWRAVGVRQRARGRVPRPFPGAAPPRRSQSCGRTRPVAGHRSRGDRPRVGELDGATCGCRQTSEHAPRRARSASAPPAADRGSSSGRDARCNRVRDGCTVPRDTRARARPRGPRNAVRASRLARQQGRTERRRRWRTVRRGYIAE